MSKPRKTVQSLRSQLWFNAPKSAGDHKRRRIRQAGFTTEDFKDKPVIGILSTWSDFNTCHAHFPQRIEEIKRGIWQAGGFPAVIPLQSVSESFSRPTAMLYRNFLAMEAEEAIRSHPVDGVVLLGGCDKTTPGLVMGAASAGVPAIYVPAGAMLRGHWRGATLGTGTSTWQAEADYRAGLLTQSEWEDLSQSSVRSTGTCNTMGTASTMTTLVDVLGLSLPGASSIPAIDAEHARMASAAGRRIVEMVWEDLTPKDIVSTASLRNAVITDMAISGSTNSLIHLVAMAGRLGHDLSLADFGDASEGIPVVCNLMPAGQYLMEDFHFAGGIRALLGVIAEHLDLSVMTATGRTLSEEIAGAKVWNEDIIRPLDKPIYPTGALVVLKGSLAPRGAVLKRSAASPELLRHTGPAVVFKSYKDLHDRIDDPALEITRDSVLILQNAGPIGAPGMPEWGMLPIPKRLLAEGVRDMVRISDGRMSGTSFGTCILHVCPESHIGGPLGLVRDGDLIRLDVDARQLDLLVDPKELEARRAAWQAPKPHYERGYGALFSRHVTQADQGCDFDFLADGEATLDPEVH
ncbi:dihydroxy-acid dehydratase [Devosia sp. Root685]|uniref:L-arabinonate dehydratase n=1 Tax=Devosia sp. Root685 TaxID=1736587 RepID=UPI0006F25B2D|nr:L-arabinonate dehydratase [Devosia sp. Root685]KRA99827.1 dihydroxy-acid dehydratase [Devosia sp. Root685]